MYYQLIIKERNKADRTLWAKSKAHAKIVIKDAANDQNVYEITARPMDVDIFGTMFTSDKQNWLLMQRAPWQKEEYSITEF